MSELNRSSTSLNHYINKVTRRFKDHVYMVKLFKDPRFVVCIMYFMSTLSFATMGQANESETPPNNKPNIIVIMTDDQGQWTLGAYDKRMKTPNLDYLADQGVLFDNAMTPAPVCSAARASFHTGKMPSQHGVYDFLSEGNGFDEKWLVGEKFLAERLQDNGYRTGLFGKWHANEASPTPVAGFDHWLSYDALKAGWRNQYKHRGSVSFSQNGEPLEHTGVQAWFLTDQAIKFIDQSSSKPFFINLNYVEPHAPFEGLPERLVSQYRPIARQIVRDGGNSALALGNKNSSVPKNHEESLSQYLAAISLIDDQVGRVLDALSGRGLLENTIIAFVSDHGLLMGQYGLYGKTNASFPYNFYEESVRIPFIVYGPKSLVQGKQTRGEFVDLLDLHNTILDFSGAKDYAQQAGPGRSLRALLNAERVDDWKRYQISERGNGRMITGGKWKLVRYYKQDGNPIDHWYDLSHPMKERYLSEPPSKAVQTKMIAALDAFFTKYEDKDKSGKYIWQQAKPNFRSEELLNNPIWQ